MVIRSNNSKLPGTTFSDASGIFIFGYNKLNTVVRAKIEDISRDFAKEKTQGGLLIKVENFSKRRFLQSEVGKLVSNKKTRTIKKISVMNKHRRWKYTQKINFSDKYKQALKFAKQIESQKDDIVEALQNFETYNVVLDEVNRSIDHLKNLDKNKEYFKYLVGGITTFLPLNQPLYATVCFGIVPSLMANELVIRPPAIMHVHYKKMIEKLNLSVLFPNFHVSYDSKDKFLKERKNKAEIVIFTGTEENARLIYNNLKPRLFILNGAGHNPLVITNSANVDLAVDSILRVALQNQGQDCAAPNSILVNNKVLPQLKKILTKRLDEISKLVGPYKIKKNIIGPNTEKDHLIDICQKFIKLSRYCILGGEIDTKMGIIYPTVFEIPLKERQMLEEFFAPVIILQPYEKDSDLRLYFEHKQYYSHAMYVTVFGKSTYVDSLIKKGLHTRENILYNTDLHIKERGFLPYGGLGPAASCVFVDGVRIPGATLPQREIYNYLIKPTIGHNNDF